MKAMNLQRVGRCEKSATGTALAADIALQLRGPPGAAAARNVVEQAQLVHHFQRRRMDRVAAEVAQEIGVLFQHDDVDAGAGQQKPEHHPGRTAADDATAGLHGFHRSGDCVHGAWEGQWQSERPRADATAQGKRPIGKPALACASRSVWLGPSDLHFGSRWRADVVAAVMPDGGRFQVARIDLFQLFGHRVDRVADLLLGVIAR